MTDDTNANLGPLFETPATRVLAAAPRGAVTLLLRLLDNPLLEPGQLQADIAARLSTLQSLSERSEFLDMARARLIATHCQQLLTDDSINESVEARHLVQMAVQYFIESNDAENDTDSPIGFDDDAEVLALVIKELDRTYSPKHKGDSH